MANKNLLEKVTITLMKDDLKKIKEFAEENDMKLSSIFRKGAKELIENGKSK